MAFVEIYHQDSQVDVEHFEREFYISERLSGELFWYTGEQPRHEGGIFKIWVQMADTIPRIVSILPDWQLFMDGMKQESRFYDSVENLDGRVVELRHKEYRFVFHFVAQS